MKNTLLFALLLSFGSIYSHPDTRLSETFYRDTEALCVEPVASKVPFGDPFIMLWEDKYYAYGTLSPDGIAVYVSDDLLTWRIPDAARDGLALHKTDVWGDRWFWAPEVYYVNGKFYMYYSADEHICVATSMSPLGPFTQEVRKPMIENEKSIDNSLFIDDTGKPYLFFDRFNDGLNIWSAGLDDNLVAIKEGTMKKCIHVSQAWEKVWPRVNEGSFVVKHKGIYYMTYSANSYESQFYGIGFATSTDINGPWIKYESNPILQKPGDLVGVGHSAMFTDRDGQLRIVFHAHNSQEKIHPRHMYIGTVDFEERDGKVIMVIDENYLTPMLVE
jgi:beta-xylosidase